MAAVLSSSAVAVSGPFPMTSRHAGKAPISSHSPSHSPPARSKQSSSPISTPSMSESPSKPFNRLRSSLEQSIRTATRSKKHTATPSTDEFATITLKNIKGKEKVVEDKDAKPGMLRRLESKVNFRRTGRESVTPSPSPLPPSPSPSPILIKPTEEKGRVAGRTAYITPSLKQASVSSPALHLSSQALPSPKSQPAVPISSSSSSAALISPTKELQHRSSLRPSPSNASDTRRPRQDSKHRPIQSQPVNIPSSPSTSSLHPNRAESTTPTGRYRDVPTPPDTPTPPSGSRPHLARGNSRAASPPSPVSPRGVSPSPIRAKSRVVSPSHRGLTSASTSQLPLTGQRSSPIPRRPSVDSPRRSSTDARRPSIDSPNRPFLGRNESPSPVRPRPISPTQRSYAHNRHFNVSNVSLTSPSNPEHRELIRTATSMLCKEMARPPSHISRTSSVARDWEEVEIRMRALARLERIWGKSGATGSSTNLANAGTSFSSGGEERERSLFCEALRDGYVLCQLLNKLRSASIVKPDPREDGFVRTANVTRFLAACSSWGLPQADLFQRDDLIEATSESLVRVAETVIALIKFTDAPIVDRSRILSGQSNKSAVGSPEPSYPHANRTASTSTPNLVPAQRSVSPQSPSDVRRRANVPPVLSLSPVHSETSDEAMGKSTDGRQRAANGLDPQQVDNRNRKGQDTSKIISPPPRSPLRSRPSKLTFSQNNDDDGLFTWAVNHVPMSRSSVTDSTRASVGDASVKDYVSDPTIRQSVASSAMTDSTTTTVLSSLLDVGRKPSSVFNKFGTIRTITTEATSESPSITRTEGSSIAEDLRKHSEFGKLGERKISGSIVDLSRVVEEAEDSASSSRGTSRDKRENGQEEAKAQQEKSSKEPALRLGKGKWPDDFIDAIQHHKSQQRPGESSSPPSSTGPRKVAIVGEPHRPEGIEDLGQFPRRPSHRARHSIDAPVLLPKDPAFRRDISPDRAVLSGNRILLRRNSTKPGGARSGGYIPKLDEPRSSSDNPVPFPRTGSRERISSTNESPDTIDKPRPVRGRFQSDVEGTKRRVRPYSYDELGAKPQRSRFESMVNLGASSGNTSASDLINRDSVMEGSAVRKPLIIREEGKVPTHFQLGNCIGRGQFGSVYRALNLNTGQMVAVKRIRLEGLKEEEVTTLMREVDLVKSLSHPSIVKYEGMARDADTLSIVLEYAENGSLGQTLKAFGKLNERLVASYVVKILEGLHYLHESDVVHCDLKAANILTTKNGNVKLSDFGVSLNMRAMEREIKDVAGTPNWMAPEVIELKGASPKSDIWSLACTVIELFTGKPPYAEIANSMSVMFRIVEDSMPPIPEACSPLLEDFLRQCFNKDPTQRPSAETLFEHQWLKVNWSGHKELRPQDSIPFLRRVSADLQKSDAVRFLSQIDGSDSPVDNHHNDPISGSPPGRRLSNASQHGLGDNDIAPREHSFVKTTFSKPMICRVCLLNVKKSAVICAQCSLISHAKCVSNSPPTCDLRAQLLLYAQYAQKGNPGSAYHNPLDVPGEIPHPKSPVSDVSYVAHSPRTSMDQPPPTAQTPVPPVVVHPPNAFKRMTTFKKSRSNPDQGPSQSTTSLHTEQSNGARIVGKRSGKLERPQSISSNSTNANSSLRSGTTNASESHGRKSVNTGLDAVDESGVPIPGTSDMGDSTHIPGALPTDTQRHKKNKSSNNCLVQ